MWSGASATTLLSSQDFDVPDFVGFGRVAGMYPQFVTAALVTGSGRTNDPCAHFPFTEASIAEFRSQILLQEKQGHLVKPFNIAEEMQYDSNGRARAVEIRIQTGHGIRLSQRYWIDASRGYICPLIELFDNEQPKERLIEQWKSSEYFLHEQSGLWFPEQHVHSQFDVTRGKPLKREHWRVDRQSFELNHAVPDNAFTLVMPVGSSVLDSRTRLQRTYNVTSSVTLSLTDTSWNLEATEGLRLFQDPRSTNRNTPTHTLITRRPWWVIMAVNGVFCGACVLILLLRRRRRRQSGQTGVWLLMFCLTPMLCCGCVKAQGPSRALALGDVSLEPGSIDFGSVLASDGPIALESIMTNTGHAPVEVLAVTARCGCTTVALPRGMLQPQERLPIPIQVSTVGRSGSLQSKVSIRCSGEPRVREVLIYGHIVPDFAYDGNAIECRKTESGIGLQGEFTIRTVAWPSLKFDWSELTPDQAIEEVSRRQVDGETLITLRLRINTSVTSAVPRFLTIRPLNERIGAITIPVFRSTPPGSATSLTHNRTALLPPRIDLGVLRHGTDSHFRVFGAPPLLRSLSLGASEDLSDTFEFSLASDLDSNGTSRLVTIHTQHTARSEIFDRTLTFRSTDGRQFMISIHGSVD